MFKNIIWLIAVVVCLSAACGRSNNETATFVGQTMGTSYSVQLKSMPQDLSSDQLAEQISNELENINALMSTYRNDSELVRFNIQTSTAWIPVSPAVATVVSEALRVSQLSDGAFDVTVNPLVELWGFGTTPARASVPSDSELETARAQIGSQHLEARLDPPALRKSLSTLSVDLSAIAKGFAVDVLAELLEQHGSQDYLVEIGGELRGRGHNANDAPWNIGIERPERNERKIDDQVPLCDRAIATSGDYRHFFEVDGRYYSHTIDPRTGKPVEHNLASVSVVAPSAMQADALATALLVLGRAAGTELALRQDIAAVFIERASLGLKQTVSPAFQRYRDKYSNSCRDIR